MGHVLFTNEIALKRGNGVAGPGLVIWSEGEGMGVFGRWIINILAVIRGDRRIL